MEDSGLSAGIDKKTADEILRYSLNNVNVNLANYKRSVLRIKASSQNSRLVLCQAKIKKLVIEKNCNLHIDLRDNHVVETVIVKDNFSGTINLSRNTIATIDFANNCRCNLTIHGSLKCFKLTFGDVFSGRLDIEDSCFHFLRVGYYCYADINLKNNWGSKAVRIGDSFRGSLTMDNVLVPDIEIGNDCKGNILISSRDEDLGARRLRLADEFNGRLDISGCQTIETVDVGNHACGRLDFSGCLSLKVLNLEKCFKGEAWLSNSAVEYIQAKEGCEGRFILFDCQNLTLLCLPDTEKFSLDTNLTPLQIEQSRRYVYYHFQNRPLPPRCFKTECRKLFERAGKYVKKHLSSPKL